MNTILPAVTQLTEGFNMGRKRDIPLQFMVSEQERDLIEQKMAQLGTVNMSAYLRKIAIDGYVVRLELPELKEMVSLLRRTSNNINQIAKRINETGRLYAADIEEILQKLDLLWQSANDILTRLAALK